MKLTKHVWGITLLVVGTSAVFAGSTGKIALQSGYRPFAGTAFGLSWSRLNRSQTLELLPPFSNHYAGNDSYKTAGSLGFLLGVVHAVNSNFFYQLGLAAYGETQIETNGHVWQFALPEFDNFTYHYRIQSKRLMATGKLLTTVKQRFHPYLSGEVGASFNRASAYDETALIEEAYPTAPFRSHTQSSFAWSVGAGVDADIGNDLLVGIGYQFADLGKVSLDPSPVQQTRQTLNFPHLYSHQLRIQFTVLI